MGYSPWGGKAWNICSCYTIFLELTDTKYKFFLKRK